MLQCSLGPVIIPCLAQGTRMSLRTSLAQSSWCFLHFRDKSWKMLRRSAGGWQRPRMVNILASFFPPTCDKPLVTLDVSHQSWSRVWSCPRKTVSSWRRRICADSRSWNRWNQDSNSHLPGRLSWLRYTGYMSLLHGCPCVCNDVICIGGEMKGAALSEE